MTPIKKLEKLIPELNNQESEFLCAFENSEEFFSMVYNMTYETAVFIVADIVRAFDVHPDHVTEVIKTMIREEKREAKKKGMN
jgi:hypothetical protein